MRAEELRKITKKGRLERKQKKMLESIERIDSGMYDELFQKMKEIGEEGGWLIIIRMEDVDNPANFEFDMNMLGYDLELIEKENIIVIKWKK